MENAHIIVLVIEMAQGTFTKNLRKTVNYGEFSFTNFLRIFNISS